MGGGDTAGGNLPGVSISPVLALRSSSNSSPVGVVSGAVVAGTRSIPLSILRALREELLVSCLLW